LIACYSELGEAWCVGKPEERESVSVGMEKGGNESGVYCDTCWAI